jgi:hypothetical protein
MMHDNNNNHFGTVNVKFVSHHVHLAATSAQGLRPEGCEPEPEVLPGVHTCGSAQSHPEQLAKVLRPRSVPRERDVGQSGHRLFGESSSSGALDQQRQGLLGGQTWKERLLPARHVQEVHVEVVPSYDVRFKHNGTYHNLKERQQIQTSVNFDTFCIMLLRRHS